jgi:hypothetical protein
MAIWHTVIGQSKQRLAEKHRWNAMSQRNAVCNLPSFQSNSPSIDVLILFEVRRDCIA